MVAIGRFPSTIGKLMIGKLMIGKSLAKINGQEITNAMIDNDVLVTIGKLVM